MGDPRGDFAGAAVKESPNPSSIGSERWSRAENLTRNIIQKVQPTTVSEERRKALTNYVQSLIRGSLHCEVFPYGSVPLKTFLPEGDIDLTAFSSPTLVDSLVNDVVSVLNREKLNKAAEFIVEDVKPISSAEVKLVKCIIQNIVVDISFNQIGGLGSLCFLEKVDHLIGKDHLFKRSIILIKAWCYYESRILGAHHALISSYALETMILYIFHLFHSALDGPLAVLYKFLDYFSKFDWENYCISLAGPVRLSSLPEVVAEAPENDGGDFLLSNDFIRYCVGMFSAPSRGFEMSSRTFQQKHLNIVDPLRENNNLGRSVSKGNFYRIRSAFTYGASMLGRVLLQSEDNIADELNSFFSNTLSHQSSPRLDVEDLSPTVGNNSSFPTLPVSEIASPEMEAVSSRMKSSCLADSTGDCKADPDGSSNKEEIYRVRSKVCQSMLPTDAVEPRSCNAFRHRLSGDATDSVGSVKQCQKSSLDDSTNLATERSISVVSKPIFAPHLFFVNSASNREMKKVDSQTEPSERDGGIGQRSNEGKGSEQNLSNNKGEVSTPRNLSFSYDSQCIVDQGWPSASGGESLQSLNGLSDLSGDYDHYFSCLQFGRRYYEHLCALPIPLFAPSPFQIKHLPHAAILQPLQFQRNGFSHGSPNGLIPSQAFYTANPLSFPGVAFGVEEMLKPRGTGTYFPNRNLPPHSSRHSNGRNRGSSSSPRTRTSGWKTTFADTHTLESSYHETPQSHYQSEVIQSSSSCEPKLNGLVEVSDFGSIGHLPPEA